MILIKKIINKSFLLLLFLLFVFNNNCLSDTYIGNPNSKKNTKVVVLDAGHGGKDSGALGSIAKEKDIALAIVLKLGSYIENNLPDIKVIYTRKTDTFIKLHERAEIANSNKADLFISVHVNSNRSQRPYGTETYAMGLHKTKSNLEVAKKENSVIMIEDDYTTKYEGFDPNSSESYIIFSLMQNAYLDESLKFASFVEQQLSHRAKRYDRGVKQAGFLVLWKTTMPSVLIETGFISNIEEEKFLMSDLGQDYIASAIFRSLKEYFKVEDMAQDSIVNNIDSAKKTADIKQTTDSVAINIPITFCIQVTTSSKPIKINSDFFKGFDNVNEYKSGKWYKYTIGKEYDYNKIRNELAVVKQKFPDAFVVAFEKGNRISLKKALKKGLN